MPPIAWVNQFGKSTCEDKDDEPGRQNEKAECDVWQAQQVRYRADLVKHFERRWLLTPGATVDLRGLNGDSAAADLPPPKGLSPRLRVVDLGNETGLEVPIPWDQLPPANSLHLTRVHIAL